MNTRNIRFAIIAAASVLAPCAAFAQEATKSAEQPAATQTAATKEKSKEATDKKYAPIAEARAKIGDIVSDPKLMTEVIRTLSPEDQKQFLADVNEAISKLPGSTEDKTAKYLNVNRAALDGAEKDAKVAMLSVTFATVPPESLAVISERWANDLFSRDADPSQKLPDEAFKATAVKVVGSVEKETTGSDDAGVRNTLAILMFVRASNGSPADLTDTLVDTIPDMNTREMARKEWIPAAMAEGENKSYDSMLAYADAGPAPNLDIVLGLAGPQILDAVLVDITSAINDISGYELTPVLDQVFGGYDEAALMMRNDTTSATAAIKGGNEIPRSNADVPWNPEYKRDDPNLPKPGPEPKPEPYPYSAL